MLPVQVVTGVITNLYAVVLETFHHFQELNGLYLFALAHANAVIVGTPFLIRNLC